MKINNDNKKAIHDVLITDMQKRLYTHGQGTVFTNDNEYTSHLEVLVDEVLLTQSLDDINDLLIRYGYLFDEPMTIDTNIFTLDGTLNYVLSLLVSEIDKLENTVFHLSV